MFLFSFSVKVYINMFTSFETTFSQINHLTNTLPEGQKSNFLNLYTVKVVCFDLNISYP